MTGTFTIPTIARSADARSERWGSSIADFSPMNPVYRKSRITVEVVRASHTHQVPQAGRPQKDPVTSARPVNMAPVEARDIAIIEDILVLKAQPTAAYAAIRMYKNIPIHAAGTWMNKTR